MKDKSKVIFGNVMPRKYNKALSPKKYMKKFGDDSM